jgi:hypothetical protein
MTCRLALGVSRVRTTNPLDVPVYSATESRPDLAIPPRPQSRSAAAVRAVFARGERQTRTAAAILAVLLVARFAVLPDVRVWVDAALGTSACYLAARLVAGRAFRTRQRQFEPRWLDAQSEVLASASFEVVRLGVQEPADPRTGAVRFRGYDLSRGEDVAALLHRQAVERTAGRSSPVRVEFAYSRGPARHPALETVLLSLADLPIATSEGARRGRIRFPAARYHAEPRVARGRRGLVARTTFWVLGPGVLSAAAPQSAASPIPPTSGEAESGH